ncbi:UNVERIFIED_CONTAM: hypothetical protein Scaly_0894700 [Sesamum calycinum]|uniref:BZIP domain-containing protein n=1 Tax=Sesamum calycinum TaxID=2727403 RepID=A0AAW2QXR6_9LAMI
MSASCSKEMAREGKRQLGVSEPQVVQNMDSNLEPGGAPDDIPMEIVELLAKNQRERALGNPRKHLLPEEINNSIRGSPSVYVDGRPGMTKFPFNNTRSGVTVGSGKTGVGQGVLNFHQLLSLMDRGIVSGSSFKVGPNGFLDKTFSPCNHHPRLNGNENQNDPFLGASFFSQSSHTKDFPGLLNGVCFSGESLKKSYLQGQMPPEQGNSKAVNLEGPSNLVTRPSRGNLSLGVCTLNRNPADFSIPDARNEYTISAKDLKSRRRNALKERSRLANMEGQKRQRARKDASGKEYPRK